MTNTRFREVAEGLTVEMIATRIELDYTPAGAGELTAIWWGNRSQVRPSIKAAASIDGRLQLPSLVVITQDRVQYFVTHGAGHGIVHVLGRQGVHDPLLTVLPHEAGEVIPLLQRHAAVGVYRLQRVLVHHPPLDLRNGQPVPWLRGVLNLLSTARQQQDQETSVTVSGNTITVNATRYNVGSPMGRGSFVPYEEAGHDRWRALILDVTNF